MADHLAIAPDANRRSVEMMQAEPWLQPVELRASRAERMIQSGSRAAGVAAYFAGLAAIGCWLLG